MGFFRGEHSNQSKLGLLCNRQQQVDQSERQCEERLATGRRTVTHLDRMREVLEQIDVARVQAKQAAADLQAVLSTASLAEAYAKFIDAGGITGDDWAEWVGGKSLGRKHHARKEHLRIVSAPEEALCSPRRSIGIMRKVDTD
jgi:hypothetical protein